MSEIHAERFEWGHPSPTAMEICCTWESERLINVLIHLILSSLVLSAPAQVGEINQADQALVTQVRQWVRQLDSDQLAQRQAAENALITLGPSILRYLPDANRVTSPEVRQRLERVTKTLQLQGSRQATDPVEQPSDRTDGRPG